MKKSNFVLRTGGGPNMVLISVVIIALVGLVLMMEMRRQQAVSELQNVTIQLEQLQSGNTQQNREAADRIIRQLRQIIEIPEDVEPTVATIVDVEALRERNAFYEQAENGNHLVVTTDRAILFDSQANKIIDVVPVQLDTLPAAADEADTDNEASVIEDVVEEVVEETTEEDSVGEGTVGDTPIGG